MEHDIIYNENCITGLRKLPDACVDTCVTSPPYYGLRDYGIQSTYWPAGYYVPMAGLPEVAVLEWTGCLGLEPTIEIFIWHIVLVFREVWRVLKPEGTLWLNLGDSREGSRKGQGMKQDKAASIQRRNAESFSAGKGGKATRDLKPKDLIGIPWRVAFAMQADGWYLRHDIIWVKPNPMPESVKDRPTKAHEYLFLLSKSRKYYYDADAIKEPCVQDEYANGFRGGAYCNGATFDNNAGGNRKNTGNKKYYPPAGSSGAFGPAQSHRRVKVPGGWDNKPGAHGTIHREGRTSAEYSDIEVPETRNKRDVWTVATQPYSAAHFATFPEDLIEPCILAGCPKDGVVCDPFMGSGTTARVAVKFGRHYIGYEINPSYIELCDKRTDKVQMRFV